MKCIGLTSSLAFGSTVSAVIVVSAFLFWYGGKQISDGDNDFSSMLGVITVCCDL